MASQAKTQGQESPEKQPEEFCAVFALPQDALLPAVCPLCAAPGMHPVSVPQSEPSDSPAWDARLCDLCRDSFQQSRTLRLAMVSSATLVTLAVTTAIPLMFGLRFLFAQIFIIAFVSALIPAVMIWRGLWEEAPLKLQELKQEDEQRRLQTLSEPFARALRSTGYEEAEGPAPVAWARRQRFILVGASVFLSVAWWGCIQSLGGATVRVVHGGAEKAILLIDGRHAGTISPTNTEDPKAGRFVRVLGGRRAFQLVSEGGELLAAKTTTIWPGVNYIVGDTPTDLCLFFEIREYGEAGTANLIQPLEGTGPVWEAGDHIDSWFQPLHSQIGEIDEIAKTVPLSGGVRRAVRLLPCRKRKVE